jgi:hypothetical protein
MKKEICYECGQVVDKEVKTRHWMKEMKKKGLPNFAKVLGMTVRKKK